MKRLLIAALAAGSFALAVPTLAQAMTPRDTGGSPGNGQAAVSGMNGQGGTPGNGQAAMTGSNNQAVTPGNSSGAMARPHNQSGMSGTGTTAMTGTQDQSGSRTNSDKTKKAD